MEFGIEPHSLFQARGTTGNDHISATLPNASHRRAVFSVQCPARHSGVAPSADHPPPEATTTTTMANRRPERAIGQWYLQTVELQERLDMQTAMQTATLGIANLANSDSEVNTRNPKRFKAQKN